MQDAVHPTPLFELLGIALEDRRYMHLTSSHLFSFRDQFTECEVTEKGAWAIWTCPIPFMSGNSHHKRGRHSGARAPGDADPGSCQKHARALNAGPVWIPAES